MTFLNASAARLRPSADNDPILPGDRFIFDLDGTLLRGGVATEGALALLRAVQDRYVLVSNNSRDTAALLSSKLRRAGLQIPPDRIFLAGEAAIDFVARAYPRARCLVATSCALRHYARRRGLVPVSDRADVVVLGRDTRVSYVKLALLANEVRRGAVLVAANPDLTHPGGGGRIVPETGALLAAVEAASGVAAAHVIGKPAAPLFLAGLNRLNASPDQVVVVGDNPLTDRAGAKALGMRAWIVHAERAAGCPNLADLCRHLALLNSV